MRNIFLLILLFAGCTEEVNDCKKQCIQMTISDSLPVQFWVNGKQTYNEKQICGVYKACFCQPIECDDEITIQFVDSEFTAYQLGIYDENDELLQSIDFDEVAEDTWQATFVPNELSPSICQKVQFKITVEYSPLVNGDFTGSLSPWTNEGSGDNNWIYSADSAAIVGDINTSPGTRTTKKLTQDFLTYTGQEYSINLNGVISRAQAEGDFDATLTVYLSNGTTRDAALSIDLSNLVAADESADFDESVNFTALNNYTKVEIYFTLTSTSGAIEYSLFVDSISVSLLSLLAQSDCLDLATSQPCSALIGYSNTNDFDGIDYESVSPAPVFYIRIPAQFWKEDNPQEQEDSVLSNGVIVTRRTEIQEKTLLEVGFVPNYFHKKIQKILMHNSVQIEDVNGDLTYWKKRDGYESENLNRYPLKVGSVWLTKYNSVEKNTI